MSALAVEVAASAPVPVVLLGTGTVGSALLSRLAALHARGSRLPLRLLAVANSRQGVCDPRGLDPVQAMARLSARGRMRPDDVADAFDASGLLIDATASDEVAASHARWLAAGHAVVTANKAGIGGELDRYLAIAAHAARYGDAATVGAGLPVLRSVRELRAGGDRILGVAGVLSGSLAWLLHHFDGRRPFSVLVREARALGYTEPDPRADLSGQDVRRKLLILARNAGQALATADVATSSLLPEELLRASGDDLDDALAALDAPMRDWLEQARRVGGCLRFVGRWDGQDGARVGIEVLAADDPLAGGAGCDNRVAIWSCRYRERPLVVQGPGAGADVTAAALLDDALRLAGAPGAEPARGFSARRPAAASG